MWVFVATIVVNDVVGLRTQVKSLVHRIKFLKAANTEGGVGDILVRAVRGENVERTPVWLMRQVQFPLLTNTSHLLI